MNNTLLQKQEPSNIITKSVNQYPNNKAQTSDGIQPFGKIGNNLVVFDVMLLSKQESNADLFSKDYVTIILIYIYISQSYIHLPKKLFVIFVIKKFSFNKHLEISY